MRLAMSSRLGGGCWCGYECAAFGMGVLCADGGRPTSVEDRGWRIQLSVRRVWELYRVCMYRVVTHVTM